MTPFSPFAALDRLPTFGQLGQAPATEATQAQGFSTIEKVLIVSTTISALGLLVHVYELAKRGDA